MNTIGVNENTALDLAVLLKTVDIPVKKVRKGDIVVDDHSVWTVVDIKKEEDGTILLCEKDDNSLGVPEDEEVTILSRTILKG